MSIPDFDDEDDETPLPSDQPGKRLPIGLHFDVSPEVYHADCADRPSLSASIATTLLGQSPAHAYLKHPRLGGRLYRPSNTMDHGTLLHALMLGRGRDIEVVDEKDWRKKAAIEARESARKAGKLAVLAHKLAAAQEAEYAIRLRLESEFGIKLDGQSEVVAIWTERADDGTEVLCRAQMDHWRSPMIYDVKGTEDAHPTSCERRLVPMGYAIQRAAYVRAIEKLKPELAGRVGFEFLFCEWDAPYAVTPMACAGTMRELGAQRWLRAVNLWARCLRTDTWPTYTTHTVQAEAKPWELTSEMEAGI